MAKVLPHLPVIILRRAHPQITINLLQVKDAHVQVVEEQGYAQCVKEKEAITPILAHIQVRVQKHGINVAHAMAQVNAVYVMDREQ